MTRWPRLFAVPLALVSFGCKDEPEGKNAAPQPVQTPATRADESEAPKPAAEKLPELPEVALQKVAGGLAAPTDIVTAPDGTMVVLDQPGKAYRLESNTLVPFADLTKRVIDLRSDYDERGLLGMAFHPDYPKVKRVFTWYSAPLRKGGEKGYDHTNVLASFEVGANGRVDPRSEKRLLEVDWPAGNHNGGTIAFGPDRMLYVSLGDGGHAADRGLGHPPIGNGQDWTTLMGSILRIDPEGSSEGKAYGIPEDNPFAGDHEGADEIWAYGLRNAYAFSFDAKGRLFAGDVGQELLEEVNLIEGGKNYGWRVKEGDRCFDEKDPFTPGERCEAKGAHGEALVDPIMQHAQIDGALATEYEVHGVSVIGGQIYRGTAIPELQGTYVFGDWSRNMGTAEGNLLAGRPVGDRWVLERLRVEGAKPEHIARFVRGFGEDADGEIYVLTSDERGPSGESGTVWRLTATGS